MNIVLPVCLYLDDNKEVNARMREELGKRLHKTEYDYTDYLKCLAKSGDVQSQYLLGLSYARGFGCVKNYCRAVKWWTKAAEQDYEEAMTELAFFYERGCVVEKDLDAAAEWYDKAGWHDKATRLRNGEDLWKMDEDGFDVCTPMLSWNQDELF